MYAVSVEGVTGEQWWRLCKAHMCGVYAVAVAAGGGLTCSNASVEMAGNSSYPVNGCAMRTT